MPYVVLVIASTLKEERGNRFCGVVLPLTERVVKLSDDGVTGIVAFRLNQHNLVSAFVASVNLGLHTFCADGEPIDQEVELRSIFPPANS